LTQQAAARVFGKGKIAFSRYENEVTYPDDGTMLMLSMAIEKPDSMKWLADRAGVELPLWRERCEDGRLSLRLLVAHDVHVTKSARTAFRSSVADWTGGIVGWQATPRKIRKIQPSGNDVIPMLEAA
jgi:HTH-type transcriptional regulator/antitoxin MqsA